MPSGFDTDSSGLRLRSGLDPLSGLVRLDRVDRLDRMDRLDGWRLVIETRSDDDLRLEHER